MLGGRKGPRRVGEPLRAELVQPRLRLRCERLEELRGGVLGGMLVGLAAWKS